MSQPRPTEPIPSMVEEEQDLAERTEMKPQSAVGSSLVAHLLQVAGSGMGRVTALDDELVLIGRGAKCQIRIEESAVSRVHAHVRRLPNGQYAIEDHGSVNGTLHNARPVLGSVLLQEGDKIQIGPNAVFRFSMLDEVDEKYHSMVGSALSLSDPALQTREMPIVDDWTPSSWRTKPCAQAVIYDDPARLEAVYGELKKLPPLVTSWEIEDLKAQIAEAQEGRRFLLQGGDCAETLDECESTFITNKLKILIQMSLVLIRGARCPVVRVGRFAGQYAKPRSKMTETRDGVTLPSYLGDLVNRVEFTPEARRPNPEMMLRCYQHAALTLNFIRSLSAGGFADLRRPELFDLSYFKRADLPTWLKVDYVRMAKEIADGLDFLRAVGDRSLDELMKITFFTSHEGLNLHYESAQTRSVPWRAGAYDLTTHMPWIGERTRALDGAQVEFFRGISNPVGVKVGPAADPKDIVTLAKVLNPKNEPGKLVLITRFGHQNVKRLEPLITAITRAKRTVLWVCDPMHGNGTVLASGVKTRNFEHILSELNQTMTLHDALGTVFGGVHFELTGEDVTECMGAGIDESDLNRNYATRCDPRLNYQQAIQLAFCLAHRLKGREASEMID